MPALLIAFIIFVFMLGGMLLGSTLRVILPDDHTQADSKDILITSAGMMATLVALIIGLLVTSAKDTYDLTSSTIAQGGAKIITLDYYLSRYGPEAKEVRELLPQWVASTIEHIWPDESTEGEELVKMKSAVGMADVYNKIRKLSPKNESKKYLQSQVLEIAANMMQS